MNYIYPTAFSSWTKGDKGPEDLAIDRVLQSDRLTRGGECEAFESEFAEYHNRKYAIYVNSGSSANEIAIAAIYLLHPDWIDQEVSLPAIAWSTTYSPFYHQRARNFIISDVNNTWNSNVREGNPKVVVNCPVLGNPDNAKELKDWANGHKAILFEDCCESLGAKTDEGQAGTFGDLSTFSFFYSHQISGIEGGMVLTDDGELARLCRLLANHGNAGFVNREEDFDRSYHFEVMGYNVRGLELHAAVAREQLRQLDGFIFERRLNLVHFKELTLGVPIFHQQRAGKPSPFGLAFEVENGAARTRLVKALRAAGIDCRLPTGGSFLKHPYAEEWRDQKTPRADLIHECGLFLGNAPYPIPHLIEAAVKIMKDVL